MFRTKDNGSNWEQINVGLTATQIMSLAINSSGHVFAGTNGYGVFRSTDNGDNWIQVLGNGITLQAWKVAINQSGILFAGIVGGQIVNLGVWMSTNNGDNWTQVSGGLLYTFIDAIAFDNQGYAYAGTLAGGLYKSASTTGTNFQFSNVPKEFKLYQNYPNPFNPSTRIKFEVPAHLSFPACPDLSGNAPIGNLLVSLKVYDIIGKEVATLVEKSLQPGTYEVSFNAVNLPSGVYFYKLEAGNFIETRKMLFIK
jgi:hypothetical protein